MTTSMAATHAASKRLKDAIFGASAACAEAAKKYGADKVTNATMGVMMDDEGKLASIPTMERVFRSLSVEDYVRYAPIPGLPDYLDAVIDLTFADQKPEGYTAAIATAGGTGAIHHAVANYAERGDKVLTSDWFWGTYSVICNECGCQLTNYALFDENNKFNIADYTAKVDEIMKTQDSLLVIINTPAHNPTGFSLTEEDWDKVLDLTKKYAAQGKKMSILVDIAYIDYAGEKNETRKFMKKFGNLPANIFVMFAFSMSKGYTAYGQRTGALVAVSSSEEVITEFKEINKYTSRATWSNINRGAMTLLAKISADKETLAQFEKERDAFYQMIQERGMLFMKEAKECGLNALPYKGGFFLSVPAKDPQAVCDKLHDDLIFAVPLKMGVRIAACSVSAAKMKGIAAKVLKALKAVEG
ncbi:aminotransferase class I/II-fold pyridoxal phosphate-dependent enzyme [Selenomonas ruminis]|uniref:Aminotransferase class I/II-fold pyridoxal phosphate-dependent enzyme n=1 Tax=Selenomonas ruminis TaxID=2593411 RepID=A0A5D6WCA7_9FIRM|nr:aminotransferase class I/II-fold pyridoxal phosphate-dependent enzyme [Selenomonas sp. mPRGC5]TYZ24649.1 aminotransferase class I/II-fold pyridoxal phosphate-dependent enzyme [Selenomonas sp. mPRGC5]